MRGQVKRAAILLYSDEERSNLVLSGELRQFTDFAGVWRLDASGLPEGKCYARANLLDGRGNVLASADEWFQKGRPDWFVNKRGLGDRVLAPFTPLRTSAQEVDCWGRRYLFNQEGLLRQLYTAGTQILSAQVGLVGANNGRALEWRRTEGFRFLSRSGSQVLYQAGQRADGLDVHVRCKVEYDGLMMTELRYGPISAPVTIESLRLRIPLKREYASLYIAIPDDLHNGIKNGALRQGKGVVFSSKSDLRNTQMHGTFAPYLWVGDMDRGLCWAAESDEGWITDDDKACIEIERTANEVILWFNLVQKPSSIDRERKVVFGLQASPVKPLPENARGIFMDNMGFRKGDVPIVFRLLGGNPPGSSSIDWTRPADDPEQVQRGLKRLWDHEVPLGSLDQVSGYYLWGAVARGEEAAKLFRGEWVPDLRDWYAPAGDYSDRILGGVFRPYPLGKDPDNYRTLRAVTPPSYVDYQVWSFEKAVRKWHISGFYDDCGYMRPIYDEDLGLGYVREDGKKQPAVPIFSVYREKWKRAAYVLDALGQPNYLCPYGMYNALPVCSWGTFCVAGEGHYLGETGRDNDYIDTFGSMGDFNTFLPGRQYGLVNVGALNVNAGAKNEVLCGRQMALLCFLHDFNPGCFGRKPAVTIKLVKLKASFRPWEPDVQFHGYWRNADTLAVEGDGIIVSYYSAKGRALFIVGNLSRDPVEAVLRPQWSKLMMSPQTAIDLETRKGIPLQDRSLRFNVPARDIRMILIATEATRL